MTIQNGCSALSFMPALDLLFLHKDFDPQTRAVVDDLSTFGTPAVRFD